jgi:hypothetical protein
MARESVKFVLGQMEGATRMSMSEIGVYLTPLYILALHSKGPVVELGVGNGYSTAALFLGAADAGTTLTSYDICGLGDRLPSKAPCGEIFKKIDSHPKAASWRFRKSRGSDGASDFSDGSVGLLFNDASHEYKQTLDELNAWLPKMRQDGIVCGHDYYLHLPRLAWGPTPPPGAWKHTGPPSPDNRGGVFKAVNEFSALHKDRFELQAIGPYDFGFFVLWPRETM